MKVLVISNMAPSINSPGVGIFVQNQVDALKSNAAISQLKFLAITSIEKGPVALLKKYGRLLVSLFSDAIFSRTRYDIVHVHYYFPTIWFALIYKLLRHQKAKIVVTFHGSDIYSYPKPSGIYRFPFRFVSHSVFVSNSLRQRFFVNTVPSDIICAGILGSYQEKNTIKNFDIIVVGMMNKNKGMDRLLAVLDDYEPGLRVAVIGQGEYVEAIKACNNVRHSVTYLGQCTPLEVADYINQSKYLLSLSRHESFGLVMAEAMACGVPVIATITDGSKEQLKEGLNGFFIPHSETQLITNTVKVIEHALASSDTIEYSKMSNAAAEHGKNYQLAEVVRNLVEVYRGVLRP
jgi:glycosyltransferase involved in cell wall biosynthesis